MTETLIAELTITDIDVDLDAVVPCEMEVGADNHPCENPAEWLLVLTHAGGFPACSLDKDEALRRGGLPDRKGLWCPLTAVWPL